MYISLFAKRTNKKTTAELFKFIAGTPIPGLAIKINYPRFHPQFLLHVVGRSFCNCCMLAKNQRTSDDLFPTIVLFMFSCCANPQQVPEPHVLGIDAVQGYFLGHTKHRTVAITN